MSYIGKTPTPVPLTSSDISDGIIITDKLANNAVVTSKITDGTIATADVANDAVTLAKMASGTDGNIISYDTSGNPVAVATGSAGQVLTSAGTGAPPTFAAAAAGGSWVKISTVTASNTSRISFDNLASTYQMYAIKGTQIKPATSGVTFNMNFGSGGGTYAANKTSLYWMWYNNEGDNDPGADKSASYSIGNNTGDQVIGYGLSNHGTYGKAGTLQVILGGLGQNSNYGSFTANYNYFGANNYNYATNVTGQIQTTADSVTFVMSSGNIETGKFTLYGIDQ